MARFCLLGPTYPFRGGIAHYTTLLARRLRQENEMLFISFKRQYPRWLFPGRSDRDPSQHPVTADAEYLLDPLNPVTWWRTLGRIRQWQPEAVIIPWWVPFWAPAWSVIGRRVRRLPGRPKLLFICHNVLPHERGWLDRLALRLTLAPGDGYLVHAQSDAHRLLAEFPEARLQITPHPTYAPLLQEQAGQLPVPVPEELPLLFFGGFVRPYKGLDTLLQALPAVLARRQVHLLVAGEFWQGSAAYREQIHRLGIAGAVTVVDSYLPNEALSACVARSDVVVLPYRNATQSGMVQVAFGLGRPVITTDVGGLPEAVDHGRTGLVVPREHPEALAGAINRFFDEELGPLFESNIRQDEKTFSWDRLVDRLVELAEG